MKRQFKAAALVSTAALLAIGASFTSMAAAKAKTGTWVLEADGWYCYDKNGEAYTNEWCLSYGKEYFVDENGVLATNSWIEDEDKFYFVGSTGAKTVNDWRYITAPYGEDEGEYWFWFDAKGEMETGKKVINNKTYYFDADGKMLTGWVTYDANGVAAAADSYSDAGLAYCDETGARMQNTWLEEWDPELDDEEEEDYDKNWHYLSSTGTLTKGKKNDLKGKTYLFDKDGKMLYGWVVSYVNDGDDKFNDYKNVEVEFAGTTDVSISEALKTAGSSVYFCGTYDQGYVKKDRWANTWNPAKFADQDDDADKYWYLFGNDGKMFVPTTTTGADKVTFVDGSDGPDAGYVSTNSNAIQLGFKDLGSKRYAFNSEGQMQSGLLDIVASGSDARYYFGGSSDGAMKTGNVTITDESGLGYKFYFIEKGADKGKAVTGAHNKYLYNKGQLVTHDGDKYAEYSLTVGGSTRYFIINNNGAIQTSKKAYKDGSDTLFTLGQNVETANGVWKGSYATKLTDTPIAITE